MSNPADNRETNKNLTESGQKKRFPTLLLLILALLLIISSVVTCILLGNRAKDQSAAGGDSFVIGGKEEPESGQAQPLHLAGRITLSDGTPLADRDLELHSQVKMGETDQDGWFLFEDVEPGLHSLFVLDEKGRTQGEIKLDISRNDTAEYSQLRIEKTAANRYLFHMASEIRFLELDLEFHQGTLTVRMDKTAAVDQKGLVSLPSQELDAKKGLVLLPSGTAITRENHIIHGSIVILPDNQVRHIPADGLYLEDGTVVSEKGTIQLPDGTVITSEGIYNPEMEQSERPEYPVQWKEPEANGAEPGGVLTVQAGQEGQNPDGRNPGGPNQAGPNGGAGNPSETNAGDMELSPSQNGEEPAKGADSVESDDPSETLAPDYGDLGVYYEEDGAWSVWKEARSIRLFDYAPGQSSTASSALPVIKPGSSGYYPFQVTNTFSSHTVKLRVSVTEETIHLPLSFRLVTENGSQLTAVSDWSSPLTGSNGSVIVANANASPPGSTVNYHLEWRWPYEAGRDRTDTAAARFTSEQSRTYRLKLEINARR